MQPALEQAVGRMLCAGFEGLEPPAYILDMLREGRLGGVIFFARNVASPAQLAALTAACREAAPRPILIAIDQEGGRVARLRDGFSESPGAMALGAAGSPDLARRVAAALAAELRALGINWNLAPVVDLADSPENPVIGTRALGNDPAHVAALALAQIAGYQGAGVAAAAKHFPGHGRTPTDTHVGLARVGGSMDLVWTRDLIPFRAAVEAGIASVMISHVILEAVDPDRPSTLSPAVVTDLLRGRIGYTGLICTDCMEMAAIRETVGPGESAVQAAAAGCDVLFYSHTQAHQEAAYEALLSAAQAGRVRADHIAAANERIAALCDQYPAAPGDLDVIRAPDHLATMAEAARAGTCLLRADPASFPLPRGARVALVEFASYLETGALDSGGHTGLGALLGAARPDAQIIALRAVDSDPETIRTAQAAAEAADVLVLATRNAHLWPEETAIARDLIARARQTALLCLSNPYDVPLLGGPGTVICTCGDGAPSLAAAVDALLGRYTPDGAVPVALV